MEIYSQMLDCVSTRDVARPILDRVTKQVKHHRAVSEKDIVPVVAAVHRSELLFDLTNDFSGVFAGMPIAKIARVVGVKDWSLVDAMRHPVNHANAEKVEKAVGLFYGLGRKFEREVTPRPRRTR